MPSTNALHKLHQKYSRFGRLISSMEDTSTRIGPPFSYNGIIGHHIILSTLHDPCCYNPPLPPTSLIYWFAVVPFNKTCYLEQISNLEDAGYKVVILYDKDLDDYNDDGGGDGSLGGLGGGGGGLSGGGGLGGGSLSGSLSGGGGGGGSPGGGSGGGSGGNGGGSGGRPFDSRFNGHNNGSIGIPSTFIGNNTYRVLYKFNANKNTTTVIYAAFSNLNELVLILLATLCLSIVIALVISVLIFACIRLYKRRSCLVTRWRLRFSPSHTFNKGDDYDCCVICLDEYLEGEKLRVLSCGHAFHSKCVDPWLIKKEQECPLCKRKADLRRRNRKIRGTNWGNGDDDDTERLMEGGDDDDDADERTALLRSADDDDDDEDYDDFPGLINTVAIVNPSRSYGAVSSILNAPTATTSGQQQQPKIQKAPKQQKTKNQKQQLNNQKPKNRQQQKQQQQIQQQKQQQQQQQPPQKQQQQQQQPQQQEDDGFARLHKQYQPPNYHPDKNDDDDYDEEEEEADDVVDDDIKFYIGSVLEGQGSLNSEKVEKPTPKINPPKNPVLKIEFPVDVKVVGGKRVEGEYDEEEDDEYDDDDDDDGYDDDDEANIIV